MGYLKLRTNKSGKLNDEKWFKIKTLQNLQSKDFEKLFMLGQSLRFWTLVDTLTKMAVKSRQKIVLTWLVRQRILA